jgi:ubiquinone/menaquinone biosynthesis C-methylase UbiE
MVSREKNNAREIKDANIAYYDALDAPAPERIGLARARAVANAARRRAGGAPPPGPAVELACGSGWLSCSLLVAGALPRIVSTDLSTGMLRATRALAGRNGFNAAAVCADSEQLPFRDDSLAFVLGAGFLHHMTDEQAFFREVRRVLAPGGVFLIFREPQAVGSRFVDGVVRAATFAPACMLRLVGRGGAESFEHEQEKCYAARDLRELGQGAGFTVLRVGHHSFFHSMLWLVWARARRFPRMARMLQRLEPVADAMDTVFGPLIPRMLFYEISASFRK